MSYQTASRADSLHRVKLHNLAHAFEVLESQRNYLLRLVHGERVARYLPAMGTKITRDICHEAGIPLEVANAVLGTDLGDATKTKEERKPTAKE